MQKIQLVTFFLFCSTFLFAQAEKSTSPFKLNTIYGEAFGQGFCYSLNYDRLYNTDRKIMNSFTAGLVFVPRAIEFGDGTYLGLPVSHNWIFGKKSHHLELGIGFTIMAVSENKSNRFLNGYSYMTPKIGYRFQRPTGGLFFRATLSPMIAFINVENFGDGQTRVSVFKDAAGIGYPIFPWPGLSIGYTF